MNNCEEKSNLFASWYKQIPTYLVGQRKSAIPEIRDLEPLGFFHSKDENNSDFKLKTLFDYIIEE